MPVRSRSNPRDFKVPKVYLGERQGLPDREVGGRHAHLLSIDSGPLEQAAQLPDLQIAEPLVDAETVHDGVLTDTDGSFDALLMKESEPYPADELSVGDQALPATLDQFQTGIGAALAIVWEGRPYERQRLPVKDHAQDRRVQR